MWMNMSFITEISILQLFIVIKIIKKEIRLSKQNEIQEYFISKKAEYIIDWELSKFCNKNLEKKYENLEDLDSEVKNYQQFRADIM